MDAIRNEDDTKRESTTSFLRSPVALGGRHRSCPTRPNGDKDSLGRRKPQQLPPKSGVGLIFFGSVGRNRRLDEIPQSRSLRFDIRGEEGTIRKNWTLVENEPGPPRAESMAAGEEEDNVRTKKVFDDDIAGTSMASQAINSAITSRYAAIIMLQCTVNTLPGYTTDVSDTTTDGSYTISGDGTFTDDSSTYPSSAYPDHAECSIRTESTEASQEEQRQDESNAQSEWGGCIIPCSDGKEVDQRVDQSTLDGITSALSSESSQRQTGALGTFPYDISVNSSMSSCSSASSKPTMFINGHHTTTSLLDKTDDISRLSSFESTERRHISCKVVCSAEIESQRVDLKSKNVRLQRENYLVSGMLVGRRSRLY